MRGGVFIMMIHEILEKAAAAKSNKEKIAILQEHNCLELRDILRGGMDNTIEFLLPPDGAPYLPSEDPKPIKDITKNFKYFIKGGPGEQLPRARVELMFLDILKKIHPKEAELIVLMKDKGLIKNTGSAYYKGITKKLVQEAFPGLVRS